MIRFGEREGGPYTEAELRAAVGRIPAGVEIRFGGLWYPFAEGLQRIVDARAQTAPRPAPVAPPPTDPQVGGGASDTDSPEPPVTSWESFRIGFGAWFKSCYGWVLLAVGIVTFLRGAGQGSTGVEMVVEAAFGSVFWACVIAAIQAWRHRDGPARQSSGVRLAQLLNESGPLTATDRALWPYLRPTEQVLFKSNAGVMFYRRVSDGVLYVTADRMVFVVGKDLSVLEVRADARPVVGRTTWLNGFVHLGDMEFVMPSREIPALESAVHQLQARLAGQHQGGSTATAGSGSGTGGRAAGEAAPATPGDPGVRPGRPAGPWLAAGLVGVVALLALLSGAGNEQGLETSSSQTAEAAIPTRTPAEHGLHIGSCLKPSGSDQVVEADCADSAANLVVIKFAGDPLLCPNVYWVNPIVLPDGRYACLKSLD